MFYKKLSQDIHEVILEIGSDAQDVSTNPEKEGMVLLDFKGFVGDISLVRIDIVNNIKEFLIDKEIWDNGVWVDKQCFVDACKKDIERVQEAMKDPQSIDIEVMHHTDNEEIIVELTEYFRERLDTTFKI